MKKIKKPISILLAVLMVFSVFAVVPFSASAEELVQNTKITSLVLNADNKISSLGVSYYWNHSQTLPQSLVILDKDRPGNWDTIRGANRNANYETSIQNTASALGANYYAFTNPSDSTGHSTISKTINLESTSLERNKYYYIFLWTYNGGGYYAEALIARFIISDNKVTYWGADETGNGTDVLFSYTITWKNDNGTVIDTTTVAAGDTPTHDPPTKLADDTNTYTFKGWDPAVTEVTGNATYTAQFTATPKPHQHDGITFEKWTSADSLPTEAGNYVLTSDVTLRNTWNVPAGVTNLCLAGHTIRQSGTGSVIQLDRINAELTVYDDGITGTITGGNTDGNGGGVNITAGTFTLKGGNIEGNVAGNGGGVSVTGKSSYFTMAGGTIRYNAGYIFTGGVLQMSYGHFTMTGGTIQNNVGKCFGGVGIAEGAQPSMSGNAVVKDNVIFSDGISKDDTKITKNESGYNIASGGTPCDVRHADANGLKINVTDALGDHAYIGIAHAYYGITTVFTNSTNTSYNDPTKFFSDDSDYGVFKNADNQLYLGVLPVASVTDGSNVTYYSSLKDAITAAPDGSTVTLLKDVTEEQTASAYNNDGNVISGKTITITSNGTGSDRKTVTGSRFDVINGGDVTFKNIIIDGGVADSANRIINSNNTSWSYYFMAVSYGSTLTFDTGATVQNYYANAHGVIDVGNGRRAGDFDTSNGSSTINILDGSEFKNLGANYGVFREDYKSTINMSGGSVTNCTSFANESVFAYVAQGSVFNMTGGEITGCSPKGSAKGLIFLHEGQANGNNKFTMTGGTISGNTAVLGGAVYSDKVDNTVTVGGSAVATGNTGTQINNGQPGSSNFYLAPRQKMTLVSDNHLNEDSLIGIYSATAPTDIADVMIATGAVKEDIKHIHSDLPGNAGIIYCDGTKDWIWYNDQFVEVSCHHTSHQSGTVWLSTAVVNTNEVTFDTDGGTPATIPAQTVISNSKATKPTDPTKDGYMFDGWYNGDTKFDFDTPITANTNLKAKWSVPVASVTTADGKTTKYIDFIEARNAWTEGTTLTLLSDIEMTQTPGISVTETKTLDLNGKTLSLASSVNSNVERVIEVTGGGDLTIKDSSGTNAGKITGASPNGGNPGWSAGLYINRGSTATMYGGTITGNTTEYGAGVWIDGRSGYGGTTFNMYGGVITGNTAEWGGGVYVGCRNNGDPGTGYFNMFGGTITGNTATDSKTDSDNVYNAYNGVTTHTGGTIDGGYVDNRNLYVTVSFDVNGGTGTMSDQYVKQNTDTKIKANENYETDGTKIGTKTEPAFTREEYTFAGWNTKKDGSGTNYTAGMDNININANTTLYANWKPKTLIAGHSLSLDGNIGINFYLDPSVAGLTAQQVNAGNLSYTFAWANGNPGKAKVDVAAQSGSTFVKDGELIKVTCHVCAAEMTCDVDATFKLGDKTQIETYSVRKYCDTVLKPTEEWLNAYKEKYPDDTAKCYDNLEELVEAMLNYGAMAQTKFKVNTGKLANAGVTYNPGEVTTAKLDTAIAKANGTGIVADNMNNVAAAHGAKWYSTSLIYLDNSTLRHYFVKATNAFNPSDYQENNKSNYYYYVEVTGIPAEELDKLQSFTVGTQTFKYSALDFVKGMITSSADGDSKNLAKSLYWYNQAANEYFV